MKFVVLILDLKNKKNDLALDKTDWNLDKKYINILTLGVKEYLFPIGAHKTFTKKKCPVQRIYSNFF